MTYTRAPLSLGMEALNRMTSLVCADILLLSVHHQQSELGGSELCSGLPPSDAGGHEVAL